MRKQYYTSYDLKKLGVHYKTIRAVQRIQRKQIYSDKQFEDLKIRLSNMLSQLNRTGLKRQDL